MWFRLGIAELIFLALLAIPTLWFYLRRDSIGRWLLALFLCFSLAACLTPADPMSQLLFGLVCFGCYLAGAKQLLPSPQKTN